MTNRIDRLEAAGLVKRTRDDADRRGVRVTLTPAGRDRVDDALTDLLERERHLLAALDRTDRRVLADLLRVLVRRFDQDADLLE
jgi:DNA-binding MarR family transcriptional regulator